MQLSEKNLKESKITLFESVYREIASVKLKLQEEFDKMINNLDECHENTKQIILNKTSEKARLDSNIADAKLRLQNVQEILSSLQKYLPPLSSTKGRLKLIKEKICVKQKSSKSLFK